MTMEMMLMPFTGDGKHKTNNMLDDTNDSRNLTLFSILV
jgi:hypothetical protein